MAYELIWCTSIILYKHCKGNSIHVVTKNIIRNCNAYENLLKARNSKYISLNGIKEHLICFISSGRSAIVSDIIITDWRKRKQKNFWGNHTEFEDNLQLWTLRKMSQFLSRFGRFCWHTTRKRIIKKNPMMCWRSWKWNK